MDTLTIQGKWFKDPFGRTVMLRGINLGGDCKYPYPRGATHYVTDFSDSADVSFIGRPFPEEEAEEHFSRLKKWGINTLRLLTTWEAIEHKGPGLYDVEYLDYFTRLCRMAGEFGMYVFVDLHQDVWSRMTGGDGAPCWLFEKVGIDYRKISHADAAVVMQHRYDFSLQKIVQKRNYPVNVWFQNNRYFGAALMNTLFFGGSDFAPDLRIDGMNVQEYMQEHYIGCQMEVAKRVAGLPNVIGFNTFNEPDPGWIGHSLKRSLKDMIDEPGVKIDPVDALYISHGNSLKTMIYDVRFMQLKLPPLERVLLNSRKEMVWLKKEPDLFQKQQVWEIGPQGPVVLKNDYFQVVAGRKVDFEQDYLFPFFRKMAERLHSINKNWMIFGEKSPKQLLWHQKFHAVMPANFVNGGHWYDLLLLHSRKSHSRIMNYDVMNFRLALGEVAVKNMYLLQLHQITEASKEINDGCPTLISEFGIPFNMDRGKAFRRWKKGKRVWSKHIRILNSMYNTMDQLLLNCTLWNYTASNSNRWGDGWNQEDFSVFSRDQQRDRGDINSGGRALEGFVRPYPVFVQGRLIKTLFHYHLKRYHLEFEGDPGIEKPTEIFIPELHFGREYHINISKSGVRWEKDAENQLLKLLVPERERIVVTVTAGD